MSDFLRQGLSKVEAYVPGEQPSGEAQFVKLNTNENPYPPSPVVEHAVRHFDACSLRLYPDPVCTELRTQAARVYRVSPEQIFVGNGSDEVLALIMRIAIDPGDRVVYPYPTYVLYRTLAQIAGGEPVEVELEEDFSLPPDFPAQAGRVTFLACPNSPTANLFRPERIEATLDEAKGLVVVDEAYADFIGVSMLDRLDRYANLVVLRTLSKSYGLAGLRVGFAFANRNLIEALYRVKDSYNVNRFSQVVARAALSDAGYMKATVARIINSRLKAVDRLKQRGFRVYPTAANFLFAEHERLSGRQIQQELRAKGILVRYFDQRRLQQGVRITIGTEEQMERLYQALDEIQSA